jgi:hypothetical protein
MEVGTSVAPWVAAQKRFGARTDFLRSTCSVAMNSVDASKTFLTRRLALWTLDI